MASRKFVRTMLLAGGAIAVLACTGARAQTTPDQAAQEDESTEIIVTANKRAERLQDVALSIAAIRGDDLTRNQLVDLQDLSTRVAGLNLQRGGQGGGSRIILRGLNTGGQGATVASVVDDVPISFSSAIGFAASFAADFDPYDLDRVEVLRGPQGTLYGASAQGGLIKYVTKLPDFDGPEMGFDAGAANLRHGSTGASGKAYLNLPLSPNAAIRASGYYDYTPGWIDNDLRDATDRNTSRRYGGRVSLLVEPTESLSLRATVLAQNLELDGFDNVEVNGFTSASDPFGFIDEYNFNTFLPQPYNNRSLLLSGDVQYQLGSVNIQSITSFVRLKNDFVADNTLFGTLSSAFLGRPNTALSSFQDNNVKKFNQEVRLSSDNDSAKVGRGLQWQAGVYYTREKVEFLTNFVTRNVPDGVSVTTPFSPTSPNVLVANLPSTYREVAGYADLTYFFSPQFDIELGARVFRNTQDAAQTQGGAFLGTTTPSTLPALDSSETDYTFSVAPRFRITPDALIYARVASGYRPGGPQLFVPGGPASLPTQYNSDSTINYEAGFKATLFDRMLSVDIAAFYIDWSDIQITVSIPVGGVNYSLTGNAGEAVSKGVEWNLALEPAAGLRLSTVGTYTDAKLTSDAPGINGFDGDRLPYVPKINASLVAEYEWPIASDYRMLVSGSWSYTGSRFSDFSLSPAASHLRVPSYDSWAAQVGIQGERFGVRLYGKNLTDTRGITNYSPGQSVFGVTIPGQVGLIRPREIGVRLTGSF